MADILNAHGMQSSAEVAILAPDYHNGPLSLLIPFGLWGLLAFGWFLIASGRVLYRNYKFGEESLRHINVFLLAVFLTRVIFFFAVFGAIGSDVASFLGLIGLSVSINGAAKKVGEEPRQFSQERNGSYRIHSENKIIVKGLA